jgi:hypothetical protein
MRRRSGDVFPCGMCSKSTAASSTASTAESTAAVSASSTASAAASSTDDTEIDDDTAE